MLAGLAGLTAPRIHSSEEEGLLQAFGLKKTKAWRPYSSLLYIRGGFMPTGHASAYVAHMSAHARIQANRPSVFYIAGSRLLHSRPYSSSSDIEQRLYIRSLTPPAAVSLVSACFSIASSCSASICLVSASICLVSNSICLVSAYCYISSVLSAKDLLLLQLSFEALFRLFEGSLKAFLSRV
jgi:hypothetical protein